MRHPLRQLIVALLVAFCVWPRLAHAAPGAMRWHTFTSDNGLAGNIVQAIWEDGRGRVWFGTENGLSRYDGQAWQTYRTDDGLLDNNVWSISGDGDAVWCATSSGLSVFENGRWRSFSTADGLPGNDVRAVAVARDGTVWAGTFGQGIARLAPGATRWEAFALPAASPNRGVFVQAIWQSPAGPLWFGTNGDGALRLKDGAFEQFSFRAGSRNTVWGIGSADAEAAWMATFRGIVRVGADNAVKVTTEQVQGVGLASTEVLAVAGGAGDLWFGTRANGAFRLRGKTWERFTTADGLARNYVQTILADRAGRVWFGTRGGGVTLLDSAPLNEAALRLAVAASDIGSGKDIPLAAAPLESSQNNIQFSFGADARWLPPSDVRFRYWLERRGEPEPPRTVRSAPGEARAASEPYIALPPGAYRLHVAALVGADEGHEQVFPFSIRSAPPRPRGEMVQVRVADQPLERGLTLPQPLFDTPREIDLRFAADDDATAPEALRYRYRVVSPGAPWQQATGSQATLTLGQGAYTVEAQAIDADGNMSPPVRVAVIVPGPLWKTLLFYLLLIIVPAAIGGLGGATLYRRQARRQALRRAVSGYVIPYDVGSLITVPDRYIGRAHVLDTILGKIANNSFYIYGEKRIGKTSLLLQLKHRLAQRNTFSGEHYIPVFRNIQDLPERRFWHYLVRSVAAELASPPALLADGDPEAGYDDLDAESDLETIVAHVAATEGTRPVVVLLLDEVDTLARYHVNIRQRFRAFCQHAQRSLRVVLAGVLPPEADVGDTSPWYNIFERVTLGPLARADALHLIRNYNHNPYDYAPEAEGAVLAAGDGKPFDTQWLCSEAVRAMLAERRTTVHAADVALAAATIVRERAGEYAAVWKQLDPAVQAAAHSALGSAGELPPEPHSGAYDPLLAAGLALPAGARHRLTALFRQWMGGMQNAEYGMQNAEREA